MSVERDQNEPIVVDGGKPLVDAVDEPTDERARQIAIYVGLGIPDMLGVTPEAYADSFPRVTDADLVVKEGEFAGRLVYVDPRVTLIQGKDFNALQINVSDLVNTREVPDSLYAVVMNDPSTINFRRTRDQEEALISSGVANLNQLRATANEVAAFMLMYPEACPQDSIVGLEAGGSKLERQTIIMKQRVSPVFFPRGERTLVQPSSLRVPAAPMFSRRVA